MCPYLLFVKGPKKDKSNVNFKDFSNIVVVHCTSAIIMRTVPLNVETR